MKPLFDVLDNPENELICGIDEVGRGPLAGPVVAAAVVLNKNYSNPLIIDSKKLNSKKIQELAEIVKKEAISFAIGLKDAQFIDKHDILTATFRAMEEAFYKLKIKPSLIHIDGHIKNPYIKEIEQISLVKGESKSVAIAAASIIAKDFRDKLMVEYAKDYPQYAFEKHKGYGTKLHLEMIKKYGPSPIHRRSFLKSVVINDLLL